MTKMTNVHKVEQAKVLLSKRAPKLGRAARGIKFRPYTNPFKTKNAIGDFNAQMFKRGGIRYFFAQPGWINSQSIEMIAYAMGFHQLACNDKKTVALNRAVRRRDDFQKLVASYNVVIRQRLDQLLNRPAQDHNFEELVSQNTGVPMERLISYDETPPLYYAVREAMRAEQ